MKSPLVPLAALILTATIAHSETFTIAGFTFDQASAVKTASVVEGAKGLGHHSNKNFGKYSEEYLRSPTVMVNEFSRFNRTKTLGYLIGGAPSGTTARHIDLKAPVGTRVTVELTWGKEGLPNAKGEDFYVFESGNPDIYALSARKEGSNEFSPYHYKFSQSDDKLHAVNGTAFDLSDFGLAEGEVCSAIRIRNIWGSSAKSGPDKVSRESGDGIIVPPTSPDYKNAFPLCIKSGGQELRGDEVDPDLIYVVGRHPLVPLKMGAAKAEAAPTKEEIASGEKK